MTRDEIYDHLAQVYLGKKKQQLKPRKSKEVSAWLFLNIIITVVIFATSFYGLTAFLAKKGDLFQKRIIYALNKGPIRIPYSLEHPYPQVKTFSLSVSDVNAGEYGYLAFAVRGAEEGTPGTIRVEIRNQRQESASVFVDDIGLRWRTVRIPLKEFDGISDWSSVSDVQFVLESWNAVKLKGILLIDDVCFSSATKG